MDGVDPPELVSVALAPDGRTMYALDQANYTLWIADREGTDSESINNVVATWA